MALLVGFGGLVGGGGAGRGGGLGLELLEAGGADAGEIWLLIVRDGWERGGDGDRYRHRTL